MKQQASWAKLVITENNRYICLSFFWKLNSFLSKLFFVLISLQELKRGTILITQPVSQPVSQSVTYIYIHSEDGVVWLWHPVVNLYIWLTISSCYGSMPLALGLIGRDGGLSTLCHSCGFACQQRVLKTFPVPDYLRSEDGVVWLWHLLVNLYIWLIILYIWLRMR